MSRAAPLLALLALACLPRLEVQVPGRGADGGGSDGGSVDGGTGDGGTGDGGTGDGGLDLLNLNDLIPGDGPASGGTEVELLGGPFDDSVRVDVGGAPATVLNVQSSVVRLRIPAAPSGPGPVDVTATLDDAQGTLVDAWTWWPTATGQASMLATWLTLAPQDGSLLGPRFEAWFRFVDPTDVAPWVRYGVTLNACGPVSDPLSSNVGPAEVLLGHKGEELSLVWDDARGEYRYPAAGPPKTHSGAPLGVALDASSQSPAVVEPDLLDLRGPIQLKVPLLGPTPPTMPVDAFELAWTDPGADHVMISVGADTEPHFVCIVDDPEGYVLPAGLFEDLEWRSSGSVEIATVWLAVAAVDTAAVHLAHDDGELRIDAGAGVVGTVQVVREAR